MIIMSDNNDTININNDCNQNEWQESICYCSCCKRIMINSIMQSDNTRTLPKTANLRDWSYTSPSIRPRS